MPTGIYRHKPLTDEHKRKISEAKKGHIVTEATRRKISKAGKGRPGNRLGEHHSKEAKKKMSEVRKERDTVIN